MESIYKSLLFYDIVKCVTEYLDNTIVKYEVKLENIEASFKSHYEASSKITFRMRGGNNIEVVHNITKDIVYIVSDTNAFSFDVFSKNEIIKIISHVALKVKQGE